MGGYLAYPEYKESGVEWLGEIPAHWEAKRLRFVTATNPSKNEVRLKEDEYVSFIPMEAVGEYGGLDLDTEKTLEEIGSGYTYFAEEDVVLAKITPCFENGKSAVAKNLTNRVAFGTTELYVLRACDGIDNKFLFYITISHVFRNLGEAEMYGAGGQKRVPESFIRNFCPALPPISEQRQIAAFLDYKTGQIDALIAKKEALLEKLAEKRTALISQAVTKGLDPTVPMQDSGIPWLGDIPAHWEPIRLKFLILHIEGGFSPQCHGFPPGKGEWGVLKTGCVNGGVFNPLASKTLPEDVEPPLSLEVHQGDVLMSRASGSIDLIGSVALVEEQPDSRLLLSDKTFRLSLNCEVCETHFFVLAMGSPTVRQQIHQVISGAEGLANNIAQSAIRELVIALPPLIEQKGISKYLKDQFLEVDKQATYILKAIESFKEYRTALITNAVTGKIDVRDIKLPTHTLAEAA